MWHLLLGFYARNKKEQTASWASIALWKKTKFWENSLFSLNRSEVGSIAWSSLGGEMDFGFAGSLGLTLFLLWE